jgi:hypothetical protein
MKGCLKLLVILVLVGMLVSILVACSGGGSVCSATPEDAIKGSFKALESKDADKLVSYCAEGFREEIKAKMAYAFSLVDQIKISDLEISTVSKTEDTATLEVEFDRKITAEGSLTEEHVKQTYELAKADNCWQLLGEAIDEETTLLTTPVPTPTPAPLPEDTVELYLSSLEPLDANGVSRCFTAALRDGIRQDIENFRSQVSRARISNSEITVISKTQNKATVEVEYDMQITAFGQTQSSHIKENLQLDKVGDEWLISVKAGPGAW